MSEQRAAFIFVLIGSLIFSASHRLWADGGVHGRVTYSGSSTKEVIHMDADATCMSLHPQGFDYKSIAVDGNGGLANVFIYVKKGLEGQTFPAPTETKVVLDQKGCWYHPRVFGIMAGQKMEVQNSDPLMHNVNAEPEFNAAMPPGTPELTRVFREQRIMFPIHCNIHAWMHGFVGVVKNPYYAVTSDNGSFNIKDLPPGRYTLEAWQEKLGTQTKVVTVGPNGTRVNFSYGGGGGSDSGSNGDDQAQAPMKRTRRVARTHNRPSMNNAQSGDDQGMGGMDMSSSNQDDQQPVQPRRRPMKRRSFPKHRRMRRQRTQQKIMFLTTPDGNKNLKCSIVSSSQGKMTLNCSVLEEQQ